MKPRYNSVGEEIADFFGGMNKKSVTKNEINRIIYEYEPKNKTILIFNY